MWLETARMWLKLCRGSTHQLATGCQLTVNAFTSMHSWEYLPTNLDVCNPMQCKLNAFCMYGCGWWCNGAFIGIHWGKYSLASTKPAGDCVAASDPLVRFPNPLATGSDSHFVTGSDIHGSWGIWLPLVPPSQVPPSHLKLSVSPGCVSKAPLSFTLNTLYPERASFAYFVSRETLVLRKLKKVNLFNKNTHNFGLTLKTHTTGSVSEK